MVLWQPTYHNYGEEKLFLMEKYQLHVPQRHNLISREKLQYSTKKSSDFTYIFIFLIPIAFQKVQNILVISKYVKQIL